MKWLPAQSPQAYSTDDPWSSNAPNGILTYRTDLYPDGLPYLARVFASNNVVLGLYYRGIDTSEGSYGTFSGLISSNLFEANATNAAAWGVGWIN